MVKKRLNTVYGYIKLTTAHAYAVKDLYLLSEMLISLTVQKWTEFARSPIKSIVKFSSQPTVKFK